MTRSLALTSTSLPRLLFMAASGVPVPGPILEPAFSLEPDLVRYHLLASTGAVMVVDYPFDDGLRPTQRLPVAPLGDLDGEGIDELLLQAPDSNFDRPTESEPVSVLFLGPAGPREVRRPEFLILNLSEDPRNLLITELATPIGDLLRQGPPQPAGRERL